MWIVLHARVSRKRQSWKMQRPDRDLTLDIAVNVSPCLSMFPISIIAFCRIMPCALWIVKPHAIRSGSFLHEALVMGEMGT